MNYYDPSGHIALELFASGTAIYYLLAAIGALLIGLGTTIASTSGKANPSPNSYIECGDIWNDFTNNISIKWKNVSNWWNEMFNFSEAMTISNKNTNYPINMEYKRKKAAPRIRCKSKKEARQRAFLKGGKKKPILHFKGAYGSHFHPNDPKFSH